MHGERHHERCLLATTPADPIAPESRTSAPASDGQKLAAAQRLQSAHYKLVLTLYRVFAIVVLYLVLIGILTYAWIMGFYAVNTSWAAPLILSASDEKSLDFREKLVTSQQTIEDLKVDTNKLETGVAEMKDHRAALMALEPQLRDAIAREKTHNSSAGPELAQLDQQKLADNIKTQKVLTQLKDVEANIKKDLAAGLITKGDAAQQLSTLNQAQDAYTDSKIAEVLLTDSVLDKTTTGTNTLNVLEKQAELQSEVAQLDIAISVAEKQLQEESRQILRLREAIATAKQSPYFLNASGGQTLYFAFVPYDNQAHAVVGSPIYDCYLNMIVCRHAGTVKAIFPAEEQAIHPIFRTQIRGFMIQMTLDHAESAKSRTVFLGRKPLLF